ncbi:hypothetical protein [Azospirillum palustre]
MRRSGQPVALCGKPRAFWGGASNSARRFATVDRFNCG